MLIYICLYLCFVLLCFVLFFFLSSILPNMANIFALVANTSNCFLCTANSGMGVIGVLAHSSKVTTTMKDIHNKRETPPLLSPPLSSLPSPLFFIDKSKCYYHWTTSRKCRKTYSRCRNILSGFWRERHGSLWRWSLVHFGFMHYILSHHLSSLLIRYFFIFLMYNHITNITAGNGGNFEPRMYKNKLEMKIHY